MNYLKQIGNYLADRACLALVPMDQRIKAENNLHAKNLTSLKPNKVKAWEVSTIDKVANETFAHFHIDKMEKATSNPFALIAEFFNAIGRFILKRVITVKVREKAISQKEALEKKEGLIKSIRDAFPKRMNSPIQENGEGIIPYLRDIVVKSEEPLTEDNSLLHKFAKDLDRHRFATITSKKEKEEPAVIIFSSEQEETQIKSEQEKTQIENAKEQFTKLVSPEEGTSLENSPYHKTLQILLRQDTATPIITGLASHLEEVIKKHIEIPADLASFPKGLKFNCGSIAIDATIEEGKTQHTVIQSIKAPIRLMHEKKEIGSYETDLVFHIDPKSGAINDVSTEIKNIELNPALIGPWK